MMILASRSASGNRSSDINAARRQCLRADPRVRLEVSTTNGDRPARDGLPRSGLEIWKSDRNSSRKASNS